MNSAYYPQYKACWRYWAFRDKFLEDNVTALVVRLDELGKDGWELVSSDGFLYIFKKKVWIQL